MSNMTRLDSLQVGEKFKFSAVDSAVWVHLGFDADSKLQRYKRDPLQSRLRDDVASLGEGSQYVLPLDPPPAVPES